MVLKVFNTSYIEERLLVHLLLGNLLKPCQPFRDCIQLGMKTI